MQLLQKFKFMHFMELLKKASIHVFGPCEIHYIFPEFYFVFVF